MIFEFSELRESVLRVLGELGTAADEEKSWSKIVELGWLLIAVPEELGGLAMGIEGSAALHAELGYHLSAAPFLPAMLSIDALCQSRLAPEVWLDRILEGEIVTAPLADCNLSFIQNANGGGNLFGLTAGMQSADRAYYALVWTKDNDAIILVELDQANVHLIERPTWDTTRRLFDIQFNGTKLEQTHILASGREAESLIRKVKVQRDLAIAAESIGCARALLKMTLEHLQTRHQFGRPLALFQALKHRCADLETATSAAEALLNNTLSQIDDGIGGLNVEYKSIAVKHLAATNFTTLAEEALQLHGGIGMASEHPCHLFLKRALLNIHLGRNGACYEQEIANNFLANL